MIEKELFTCKICGVSYESNRSISKHISQKHQMSIPEYYLKYINPEAVTQCPYCAKEGKDVPLFFRNLVEGFTVCCKDCNRTKNKNRVQKFISKTKEKYGAMGLANKEMKENMERIMLEKHGVKNASQVKELIDKRNATKKENKELKNANIN